MRAQDFRVIADIFSKPLDFMSANIIRYRKKDVCDFFLSNLDFVGQGLNSLFVFTHPQFDEFLHMAFRVSFFFDSRRP